jgi:predicted ATP-dependent protease
LVGCTAEEGRKKKREKKKKKRKERERVRAKGFLFVFFFVNWSNFIMSLLYWSLILEAFKILWENFFGLI